MGYTAIVLEEKYITMDKISRARKVISQE